MLRAQNIMPNAKNSDQRKIKTFLKIVKTV